MRVWTQYGQCDSFEGAYRSPQHWHPPQARPIAPLPADAWDIELAARIIAVRYHALLRLMYHAQFPAATRDQTIRGILRRRLKWYLSPTDFMAAQGNAHALIVRALEVPAVVRKQRAQEWVRRQLAGALTDEGEHETIRATSPQFPASAPRIVPKGRASYPQNPTPPDPMPA